MAAGNPEDRVKDLPERLHEAAERVEALREEAAELAANLRNRIQVTTLQRDAIGRLDAGRERRLVDERDRTSPPASKGE